MAKNKNRFGPSGGQSASTSDTKFKSPTPGLEDVQFTYGTSMAAVKCISSSPGVGALNLESGVDADYCQY